MQETEGAERPKDVVSQAKEMVEGGARRAKETTQEILKGSTEEGKMGTGEQVAQGKTEHGNTEEQQPGGGVLEQPKGIVTQAKETVEAGARKAKETAQGILEGSTKEGKMGTGEQVAQGKTEHRKAEKQQPGGGVLAEQPKGVVAQAKEMVEGGARKAKETTQEILGGSTEEGKTETGEQVVQGKTEHIKTEEQQPGGGVLGAIGETIVEIAQTTKEFVVGQDEPGGEEANLAFSASSTDRSEQGEHKQDRSK